MKSFRFKAATALLGLAVASATSTAWAGGNSGNLTLMHLSDVHGHMAPHTDVFNGVVHQNSGGLAKLATKINQIRTATPGQNLLLMVGDTTQGSAEALFTRGNAMMPALNAMGIDAFTPGNWDFVYGPIVYRNRFAGENLALNAAISASTGSEGVLKANFPTVAINAYNDRPGTPTDGQRVHPPYIFKTINGLKVAIIGITSDNVPAQADVFSLTFKFTEGYNELPAIIEEVEDLDADLVVVMSELGLAKNIQISRETKGIDVMLSAHTHEITPVAIIAPETGTIVVESGEDQYLGRLDLSISHGKVTTYGWNLIQIDETVAEDPTIKGLVDARRASFLSGAAFTSHIFVPAGWPATQGHVLSDPLDTVVGSTDGLLERHNVFEETVNNFFADAMRAVGNANIGITNGFRFDIPIAPGPITLADLYYYFPISPAVGVGEVTGGQVINRINANLDSVFARNPYQVREGYVIGVSSNLRVTTDINNNPQTSTSGRATKVEILDQATGIWGPIVRDKVYTMASCYSNGDPLDRLCRTEGTRNLKFATPSGLKSPLVANMPPNPQAKVQAAPNDVYFPAPMVRAYLNSIGGQITQAQFGPGRYVTTTPIPASDFDPTGSITQPVQGAGPAWLKRGIVKNKPVDD